MLFRTLMVNDKREEKKFQRELNVKNNSFTNNWIKTRDKNKAKKSVKLSK